MKSPRVVTCKKKIPLMDHFFRYPDLLVFCVIGLSGFQCLGQGESDGSFPYRQIGKITPRGAKEIALSDWSVGCETLDRDLADYSKYKSYLGPLGAKSIRLQGGWAKTEKQPGVYDWKWLDEIIDDAISQGVQPWVELSYGNPIYEGGGGTTLGDGIPHSEPALKAWDAWAKAMVRRYKDRIHAWEIWNEPDLGKAVDATEFAAFHIRTAEIIRSEQPDAKIYALSLSGNIGFAEVFLASLAGQGKLGLVDAVTFHGYPHNPDQLKSYDEIKAVVRKYSAEIGLRQGETGAPSAATTGALKGHSWTELSQTKWDLRRMLAHHAQGVPMNLFTLSEFVYNDHRSKGLNAKGLLRIREEDKSVAYAKPAYFAAQNVFSIFDRSVVVDKSVSGNSSTAQSLAINAYQKQPSGGSIVAIWFNGAPAAETNDYAPVDFTLKNATFEQPVYVDLRTGNVFEIPAATWSKSGDETRFRAIPVYDSPILIAEKTALLFHQ